MNKTFSFIIILLIGIITGCGNQSSNNAQQPQAGSGGFGRQGNTNPEERAQNQVDRLTEQLGLTEEQQKQVYDLTMENYENMQQLRSQMGDNADREAMREEMQKARDEQNQKMKTILSEEQWEKYQAYQEEMRARRGQGRPE